MSASSSSQCSVLAWQPLLRPPIPGQQPPAIPPAALKSIACRNEVVSVVALVTARRPVKSARIELGDLTFGRHVIPASAAVVRVVGAVPTPEAGMVCDPLYPADEFPIEKSAALHISIAVPADAVPGSYSSELSLLVDGTRAASNRIELEVVDVQPPVPADWKFFLNVWMNPGAVARWHNVELWSEQHFTRLRPYVRDLAEHGQKTVVVPICHQPWGTQTRDPYPSAVIWHRRGDDYEFDFSIFDRYVQMHEECGIRRAIHCYSLVQGPGAVDRSVIACVDADTGQQKEIETAVGDKNYNHAWGSFLKAFREHLTEKGWLEKTYLSFDEKPDDVMDRIFEFLSDHAPDFKTALAGNTAERHALRFDDLSAHISFAENGAADRVPAQRSSAGVAGLLDPDEAAVCRRRPVNTFHVCCGPQFPNTFVHSPLVESRMLPYLALQGEYDGFLRWSYNDWPDNPYKHPEWGSWPTGDTFFVYPGEQGPVSSLRWEALREGIQDYELAMLALANAQDPEDIIDYQQAVALACRSVDGRKKAVGDIEIARRLLIPIASRGQD